MSEQQSGPPATLRELYESYRVRRLRKASDGTRNKFCVVLNHFESAIGRTAFLADLNEPQFFSVLDHWAQILGSPHTANGYGAKIMALWRFACRRGWLQEWPESDWQLHAPRRVPKAWTKEQLARLFTQLSKETGYIGGIDAAGWWLCLHHVLLDTAERIGAVLSLRWEDVDLSARSILIRGECRKGDADDRPYWLHEDTVTGLAAIREPARERVFPLCISRSALWLRYKKILEKAGLPTGRESKFHRMRRTVASHVAAQKGKAAATEALDHSDGRVTEAYLDPSIFKGIRPAELLWRPPRSAE